MYMLLISVMLQVWKKLMVLMLMMSILKSMTMRMILIMRSMFILLYNIYTIPKASSKRVNDLGTSPGHEPIIDQSCGAVLFFPCRAHRDLSASRLPRLVQWI